MLNDIRDMLDATGHWPHELAAKATCISLITLMVCFMAHTCPFTIEALLAAVIFHFFTIVAAIMILGIGMGVLTALVVLMDRLEIGTKTDACQRPAEQIASDTRAEGVSKAVPCSEQNAEIPTPHDAVDEVPAREGAEDAKLLCIHRER